LFLFYSFKVISDNGRLAGKPWMDDPRVAANGKDDPGQGGVANQESTAGPRLFLAVL
jgi:hypothetical protein